MTIDPDELDIIAAGLEAAGNPRSKALRVAAEEIRRLRGLPGGDRSGNTDGMHPAERLRHSTGAEDRDPLVVAANAAGYTLRSLAEAIGKTHAYLSAGRRGKAVQRAVAEQVEELTGFRAIRRNWPGIQG